MRTTVKYLRWQVQTDNITRRHVDGHGCAANSMYRVVYWGQDQGRCRVLPLSALAWQSVKGYQYQQQDDPRRRGQTSNGCELQAGHPAWIATQCGWHRSIGIVMSRELPGSPCWFWLQECTASPQTAAKYSTN